MRYFNDTAGNKKAMLLSELARVGDTVECKVRSPLPEIIRMDLRTIGACAYANSLLMNQASGWTLVKSGDRDCAGRAQ